MRIDRRAVRRHHLDRLRSSYVRGELMLRRIQLRRIRLHQRRAPLPRPRGAIRSRATTPTTTALIREHRLMLQGVLVHREGSLDERDALHRRVRCRIE